MCALWLIDEMEDAACASKLVQDILADIRDQRAKLTLESKPEGGIKDITAALTLYDATSVTVEISARKGVPRTWVGTELSCLFRLRDRDVRGGEQLLSFASRINSMLLQSNGMVQLVLALPRAITIVQRRRNVRVDVDQRKVPVLILWPELPSGVIIADTPPLLNSETDATNGLKVGNVSAKGLRLVVQNSLMHKALPKPNKGERFSFFFKAVAEPTIPAMSFWVKAILRSIYNDTQKNETGLGFEFISEGLLDEGRRLVWLPLKLDEVSSLGKFIFKWNLDLRRVKDVLHEKNIREG